MVLSVFAGDFYNFCKKLITSKISRTFKFSHMHSFASKIKMEATVVHAYFFYFIHRSSWLEFCDKSNTRFPSKCSIFTTNKTTIFCLRTFMFATLNNTRNILLVLSYRSVDHYIYTRKCSSISFELTCI